MLASHLFVYEIEQARYQNIGNGHKIYNSIIDSLCSTSIRLTFHNCPTHGALGVDGLWQSQKKQ